MNYKWKNLLPKETGRCQGLWEKEQEDAAALAVMQAVDVEGNWVLCFTENTCSLLPPQEPGWPLSDLRPETGFKGNPLSVAPVDLEYQSS